MTTWLPPWLLLCGNMFLGLSPLVAVVPCLRRRLRESSACRGMHQQRNLPVRAGESSSGRFAHCSCHLLGVVIVDGVGAVLILRLHCVSSSVPVTVSLLQMLRKGVSRRLRRRWLSTILVGVLRRRVYASFCGKLLIACAMQRVAHWRSTLRLWRRSRGYITG